MREARDAADDDHREHQQRSRRASHADERHGSTRRRLHRRATCKAAGGARGRRSPSQRSLPAATRHGACEAVRRPARCRSYASTNTDTSTLPAFSNVSVSGNRSPTASGCAGSDQHHMVARPDRASPRRRGAMSSPAIARIRITLPSIVIECSSTDAAAGDATRTQAIRGGAAVLDRQVDRRRCARRAASRARTDDRCRRRLQRVIVRPRRGPSAREASGDAVTAHDDGGMAVHRAEFYSSSLTAAPAAV